MTEIHTFTVESTGDGPSSVASGQLSNPIQTFTVGTTPEGMPVIHRPADVTVSPALTSVKPLPKFVFVDVETTSLRPDRRAWEIALIVREPNGDVPFSWLVEIADLDLGNADLMSLKIGHFHERHPQLREDRMEYPADVHSECWILEQVESLTRGAILVGAVPNFDAEVLAARMRAHGICPSWHYHPCDVETLAAGALKLAPPWDFDRVLAAYGLTYDEADRHTALGDTRMVRDLYDAIMASQGTGQ